MAEYTDHYNLIRLTSTDLSPDSYKFSDADRVLEDALLYAGAEGHHHTGGTTSTNAPDTAPELTLSTTSGAIPANTRVYYKYTYVDGQGIETTASPESYIDTPPQILSPNPPVLSTATTGGVLQPGNYFYVLSAYDTFDSLETYAENPAYLSIGYTTATNTITLTLPTLPSGATGFNIYRQGPSNVGYRYLDSIDLSGATPATTYVDTGSVEEDPDRPLPSTNTTISANTINVSLPGATPSLPIGYYWRIYRTYVSGNYTISQITTTQDINYDDVGVAATVGQPPTAGTSVGSPSKVLLTNAAEVQGILPAANMAPLASSQITDFTEQIEDRVGTMLTDSSTIDFTYTDAATPTLGTITAIVKPASIDLTHLAYDPATQAELALHVNGVAAHAATNITYAGAADLASTTVETALDELDNEKLSRFNGVRHGFTDGGNSGAAKTISLAAGNVYRLTLTANCTLTFPTVTGAGTGATPTVYAHQFYLLSKQDGAGSRTMTWPGSVVWPAGSAPTLSTGAGAVDVLEFITPNAGTTWYGFYRGASVGSVSAAAVSYAGNVNLVSTTVEAALDELDNEKLSRFGGEGHGFVDGGNSGASKTVALDAGNVYRLTLTNHCNITFPTPVVAGSGATPTTYSSEFFLQLVQNSTGGWFPSFDANTIFLATDGSNPNQANLIADSVTWYHFVSVGTKWYEISRYNPGVKVVQPSVGTTAELAFAGYNEESSLSVEINSENGSERNSELRLSASVTDPGLVRPNVVLYSYIENDASAFVSRVSLETTNGGPGAINMYVSEAYSSTYLNAQTGQTDPVLAVADESEDTVFAIAADGTIRTSTSVAATVPGTVARKLEIFDAAGVSLGFIPIYNSIT